MTNKIILAVIAAGFWANAASAIIRPAKADDGFGYQIYHELALIHSLLGDIEANTRH